MNDADLNEDIQQYPIKKAEENLSINEFPLVDGTVSDVVQKPRDMAVVTCYFNWCGYANPRRNLNRFLKHMENENIPLYGVELSLTDDFATKDRKNWKHIKVTKNNICFQKEACINLAEKIVPEFYKKIAWIDADLHFQNKNWYFEGSIALDNYKLVQLFSFGSDTDRFGDIVSSKQGIIANGGPRSEFGFFGYPGGAWAARREMWNHGGLYPYSLMGSGDTTFINAVYGVQSTTPTNDLNFEKYKRWESSIREYLTKNDVTNIEGEFIHEWHGDKNLRGYTNRNDIMNRVDFDKDVTLDENGVVKLENAKQGVYDDIYSYFVGRNEDGESEIDAKVSDMAVLTVHFNWANFETPVKNLRRFILDMESNKIPLFGVELSLTGKFETEKYSNWIKIKVDKKNVCFQKEACINLLEKFVPEKYNKIAWIDHDIYFKNRNWYSEASKKLNTHRVIQLFSEEIFTDRFGREIETLPSLISVGGPKAEISARKYIGTPGAALAARRDLWRYGGGLFPYSIMGGGDSVLLYAIYNCESHSSVARACGYHKKFKPYFSWKSVTMNYVGESCSHINGEIVHYWHGEKNDRKYTDRHSISDKINWEKMLKLNTNGIVEIQGAPDHIYNDIYCYFRDRNEDGNV